MAAKTPASGTTSAPAYDPARVDELADALLKHKRLYYGGKPQISDAEYDKLEEELRRVSPTHPVLQMVGSDANHDGGAKIRHDQPMLSLQKTYDRDELAAWMGDRPTLATIKVDGISLSVIYEGGVMTLAKTRGNGVVGEEVTAKVAWVPDVRPRLAETGRLEVRGELYCTESRFVLLSNRMAELGLDRPTSPRNVVAGLMGRKTHIDMARFFNFFAFTVVDHGAGLGLTSESDAARWLEAQGFRLPYPRLIESPAELDEYLEYAKHLMSEDEIGIDGAVFSYDSLGLQRQLGNTSHHPRYKMSFKWQGQTATSTIREVAWATSRLGIVTPVAVIEPVSLSGASITNVTLHNAAHVQAYNLKAGDRIEIVRSGEVIPKFLSVVEAAPGEYAWPKSCPACATPLEFDEVRLKCPALETCPAQRLGVILNWIRCAEIDDLSEKRLTHLVDAGLVATIPDLYRLTLDDFYKIPQTKEKMAAKLLGNIQRSRTLPLARFLNGLGIEGAGFTTWEKLLHVFPSLAALRCATEAEIVAVEGFAEKSAQQIVAGLVARSALIDALLAAGVAPDETGLSAPPEDGPLSGMTLVITGALSRPRAEVEKAIKSAGGKTASAVSKTTSAVVTDDPASSSSKMKKARDLGVPAWSEDDLWKRIGGV
jgi:DNA ligase (NAD+)